MADSTSAAGGPIAEKLVRDGLVDKLDKSEFRFADESEMVGLLVAKLREEVDEFSEAVAANSRQQEIEELGDVYQVVVELLMRIGMSRVHLQNAVKTEERGGFRKRVVLKLRAPIAMVLICPECNGQHVDRGVWATTRIHRSHLCEHCGNVWKPFEYATVGVEKLP